MHELSQVAGAAGIDAAPDRVVATVAGTLHAACPWCAERRAERLWPDLSGAEFWLERCAHCGLVYTVPQLSPAQIADYYSPTYYGDRNLRFHPAFEALVGWFRRRRAARLRHWHPEPGAVLDIGCGRGHFLNCLRAGGWTCVGTELSEAAAQHARDVLHLDVRVGAYEPGTLPEAAFDAVYLWHVLEHLPATRAVLPDMRRILRPGGLLVIAVPNLASWQARVTRAGWFHLDLPRHYVHFTTDWLQAALRELEFNVVEVNHFSLEQNVYGWMQSLLNCAGLEPNLLYDLLKRRGARRLDRPLARYPVQSILSLVGAAALLPAALAAMLVEVACGRGGTIEVYATRP